MDGYLYLNEAEINQIIQKYIKINWIGTIKSEIEKQWYMASRIIMIIS